MAPRSVLSVATEKVEPGADFFQFLHLSIIGLFFPPIIHVNEGYYLVEYPILFLLLCQPSILIKLIFFHEKNTDFAFYLKRNLMVIIH